MENQEYVDRLIRDEEKRIEEAGALQILADEIEAKGFRVTYLDRGGLLINYRNFKIWEGIKYARCNTWLGKNPEWIAGKVYPIKKVAIGRYGHYAVFTEYDERGSTTNGGHIDWWYPATEEEYLEQQSSIDKISKLEEERNKLAERLFSVKL